MRLHEGSARYSRLLGHHRQARYGGAPELSVKAALMSTAPAAGSNSEGLRCVCCEMAGSAWRHAAGTLRTDRRAEKGDA